MPAAPYPFERWPSLPQQALGAAATLRRALAGFRADAALELGSELLGSSLSASMAGPIDALGSGVSPPPDSFPLAASLEHDGLRVTLLVHLPRELAAGLVDRVLGGDGSSVHLPGDDLDELSTGALAYLLARLLATGGGGLRLVALGPRAEADLLDGPLLLWPLTLELAGRSWSLQVRTPAVLPGTNLPRADARDPAWPPHLRLKLCAHAGTVTLTRRQLDALRPGDALLPEHCPLQRGGDGFAGQVVLHVEGAQRTRWVCHAGGTGLRVERIEGDGESAMGQGKRVEAAAARAGALAGDAPVEVCLELARFTLTLEELGQLAPGDLLSTGVPLGQQVVLRAGGVELGSGELVEIEGDVGVRLTRVGAPQKLDADATDGD